MHFLRIAALAIMLTGVGVLVPHQGMTQTGSRSATPRSVVRRLGASAWVARLSSPDPRVRRGAAYDLGHHATLSTRMANELAQVLGRDRDLSVLLATVEALGSARQTTSLLPYVQLGRTEFPPEVIAAAIRTVQRANDSLLPALLGRLHTFGPAIVTEAAARALASQPDALFVRLASQARATSGRTILLLRTVALRGDPRWSPFVLDQLRAGSRDVVLAAIDASVALRLSEAPTELVELARDAADRSVRRAALRALGALGDPADPAVLRAALGDPLVRDAALEACGQLGDARFVDAIEPLLGAPWSADRRAAAEALAFIAGPATIAALDRALTHERDSAVRAALWSARARVGDGAWIRPAVRERSGRWALFSWALRGHDAGPWLASLPSADANDAASTMLSGAYGARESARVARIDSRGRMSRLDAALSFVSTRSQTADVVLARRLTREDDESVRVALVLALGVSGSEIADEALVALLDRESAEATPAVLAAAELVGARRLRGAVAALGAMLARNDDAAVRAIAAHSLGRIADPAAAGVLTESARFEPDAEARGASLVALAIVRGTSALDTIERVDRIAWNARLIDRVAQAGRIARGESADEPFAGSSVVQVSGAEPGSIWVATMPDSSTRFAVASSDGELVLAAMPSSNVSLRRIGGSAR